MMKKGVSTTPTKKHNEESFLKPQKALRKKWVRISSPRRSISLRMRPFSWEQRVSRSSGPPRHTVHAREDNFNNENNSNNELGMKIGINRKRNWSNN